MHKSTLQHSTKMVLHQCSPDLTWSNCGKAQQVDKVDKETDQ